MFEKYREVRKWFYAILVAAGPVAVFYGLASNEEMVLWLGVGATILGVPGGTVAVTNLSEKQGADNLEDDSSAPEPEGDFEIV